MSTNESSSTDTGDILYTDEFRNRDGKVIGPALMVPPGHPKLAKQELKFRDEKFAKGNRTMRNGYTAYFLGGAEVVPDSAIS